MQTKAALARLAKLVRAETGCLEHEPFDPWAWSDANGIPFWSLDELDVTADAYRHFVHEHPHKWSALLARYDMQHVVLYNPAHSPERILSNLAHEVAHIEAEHELTQAWMDEDGNCNGSTKDQEKEAAELAGALLVPAETAKAHAIRGGSVEALASKFEVSVQMANWRMHLSGGPTIARRTRERTQPR